MFEIIPFTTFWLRKISFTYFPCPAGNENNLLQFINGSIPEVFSFPGVATWCQSYKTFSVYQLHCKNILK
jgi:hypothetical protein